MRRRRFSTLPGGGAFYVGGEGGWTWLNDATLHPTGTLSTALGGRSKKMSFSGGPVAGVRAGYEWGPWRLEEEFAYRINGIDSIGGIGVDGNRTSYAFMTNFIAGTNQWFNLGFPIDPYIGAGIGAVILRDGWSARPFTGAVNTPFGRVTGADVAAPGLRQRARSSGNRLSRVFATTSIRPWPSTSITAISRRRIQTSKWPREKAAGLIRRRHSSNNVMASFVVKFGAPPPPVVAPPVPPPPPPVQRKVFLVFFDWDRYTITPEGMGILQQAAAAFRAGGSVQIQVTGYTDRSGSPGYNQRLSERRASAVATALEGLGVPRSQMIVSGRGENDNRVPTADGVREPQNRRVEIVFP